MRLRVVIEEGKESVDMVANYLIDRLGPPTKKVKGANKAYSKTTKRITAKGSRDVQVWVRRLEWELDDGEVFVKIGD